MYKTLFMIHGMSGGPWCWENYVTYFKAKGYRCIAPALRFHDVSPQDPPDPRLGTTGLLDYAEDLEQEIRTLDRPPIVVGHSMGGLLAQILGARGLAEALVLLSPASPSGINALKFSVIRSFWNEITTWGFVPRWGAWRSSQRPSFTSVVYSTLHLVPEKEQRSVYQRLVPESGRAAFQIGLWFFDRHKASKVDETKVTCPVLVVAGKEDRITPASVVKKVAEKYGVPCKVFDHHAHWVVGEPGWEEIADYIAEWLDRNSK
jgi:pimeloyl-ACP methyl ester carboxylesterase